MACPHVTGVAALVLDGDPNLSVISVRAALHDAEDLGTVGWDMYYGHGLVDAVTASA